VSRDEQSLAEDIANKTMKARAIFIIINNFFVLGIEFLVGF